jgi:hypothetical protein
MKLLVIALAASTVMTPNPGQAGEPEKALQLRPKAAMTSAMAVPKVQQAQAPFLSSSSAEPELVLTSPATAQEASRSSCNGERSLCYDSASGRVVYKPARQLMPDIPGLRPENISLKRNQLVFRYSF